MVLTKSELIGSLHHEVNILLHLAGKLDPASCEYRPTEQQRSALELLRYLTLMGPGLIEAALRGGFDAAAWTEKQKVASARGFEETVAALADLKNQYSALLDPLEDEDFRTVVNMLGRETTRGAFFVNLVVAGHAAYRTQLFLYLKSCGRSELNTMNLWAGIDPPVPVQA